MATFCVSSPNCRVFAHVVHTLARIGEDVLFEPRANSLVLKTKNMAESSYAEIEFHSNFFSTFSFSLPFSQENITNFKVSMRALVSIVKSPHSFDKNVETCLLRYEQGKLELNVTINYSKGTTKEYIIPHIEYESFEANFSKSEASNYILSDACTLISATNQFKSGEDEITLSSSKENSVLENHLQNAKDCKTTVKTTVRVDHQYLETYSISFPTQITFCLKEFKALLALSESVQLPIAFHFDAPGKPLILEVSEQNVFRLNVLISTLQALQRNQQQTSQNVPESTASPRSNHYHTDGDQLKSAELGNATKNARNNQKLSTQFSNQNIASPSRRCDDPQLPLVNQIPGRSQRGNQNVSQTNGVNKTQNYNAPLNISDNRKSEMDCANNLDQQAKNNLETLIPNDFLEADDNDFPIGAFQGNSEPASSNSRKRQASPLAESTQSQRRDHRDSRSTIDVNAFVVDNNDIQELEAHSSQNMSNAKLGPMECRNSLSQQVYFTLFEKYLNSSKSQREKSLPKILVYNSDGLSDSD